MTTPQPLIAGNWKMNGVSASLAEAKAVAAGLGSTSARVALCPSATLIAQMAWALKDTAVAVGGQDCRAEPSGAFTGDVAAEQIKDAGASLVILGHSERRAGHGETDALVASKVLAALRAGLEPIVCVGETLEQRKAGEALAVVTGQVRGSLPAELAGKAYSVAYEPVWAIGTGLTPTTPEIEEVHRAIRATLVEMFGEAGRAMPILYGGSVKPSNAAEILHADEVGGALVGGAALKAEDFLGIIRAV
ncbi:MAG: triose-phosphate isomerase [Alphaproteobacteria bacterium]|nr:triose-phosphate isomerase [Alphaproteobacteria bacterium]MBU1513770.1 triose-phosphate isomerase [Alphaproteobacteria bacterium]MBU2094585.1 triose-phosphate isomerase [Alphaproteobacteria bacterium]MBU2149656.1 triose-phosphate isomerase [Alphaproteobacteria bacterium]MBU2309125.1 triose-phosphate isomerase [Alphaproteobacteria bacterium]